MQVKASAPGKAILFGEHAVVYGKPAIAMAINKRTCVEVLDAQNNDIIVNVNDLGITGSIDFDKRTIISDSSKKGILKYIMEALKKTHDGWALQQQ
jgi:mevalonate kinase